MTTDSNDSKLASGSKCRCGTLDMMAPDPDEAKVRYRNPLSEVSARGNILIVKDMILS